MEGQYGEAGDARGSRRRQEGGRTMNQGNDSSMRQDDWKEPYLKCFAHGSLGEDRKRALREAILAEVIPRASAAAPGSERAVPFASARPAALVAERPVSFLGRLHRSGVGYVAAAAACIVAVTVGNAPSLERGANRVDPGILRYARVLPADFDLEGDASALPSVVSEVVGLNVAGGREKGQPFELHLPDDLRRNYVPREGRFFTGPEGQLGVAIQLRPPREGGKAKTLYMLPAAPSVDDVLPQNNLAKFATFSNGAGARGAFQPHAQEASWKAGDLNYMVLDP